ncbi:hypothetical protein CC85DRAFT_266518 [Cutaneotrichosporon oleaginosum]|uniref:F-box domain-containing protein n=1 Tax=Cutaneotrichosporon oleaginosum TaxID=879819 RepID=A0A0J0XCL3_9TREE|nr:uncharacterized protein CC85DRAFT_266518 [Cutaneotrichosporon oleaginosum]KLT38797.1 hypothetical protein CC85DRAFT_266518 [Cutaneotrichosporon oleaginosum]TXT06221.1 hypothetical protein COLE_05552 [Cutaneotrichosporon oleaginosum]
MLSPPSTDNDEPLELLDLPSEILSQIASFLPQRDLLHFLSTSTALHTLTETHLTPLRAVIKGVVRKGPPYPPQFEVLPSLRHFVGEDNGRLFLDVLVRAPARWILERFEFGRWKDDIWKEAFERRFLPSWKRYKNPEDKWRAAFLRTLSRLDHRASGCAHHEAWTRFIHLRRNGSASLNRIYTRTFDPYEILDELKQQGGVTGYPTVVRVLCHLQDVRILAVGVLANKASYYVNPNAHFVVHPPLLRPVTENTRPRKVPHRNSAPPQGTGPSGIPAPPPRANSISFAVPIAAVPVLGVATSAPAQQYVPLTRTTSVGSVGAGATRRPPLFTGFNWRPGRRHSVDNGQGSSSDNPEAVPSTTPLFPLTRSWSRESDRRRSWAFGMGRRSSTSSLPLPGSPVSPLVPILNVSTAGPGGDNSANTAAPTQQHDHLTLTPPPTQLTTPISMQAETLPTLPEDHSDPPTPPTPDASPPPSLRQRFPYRPTQYPTPAYSHAQYPNYTPFEEDPEETTLEALRRVRDFRADYREVEEDADDRVWSGNEGIWGTDGEAMAETSIEGRRSRWVGPMIIIAQLFPSSRKEAYPPGVPQDSEVEGIQPNLGPNGMYASFGWEDFDTLLPWIELHGSGPDHGPRRAGMGFDTATEE